jgi:GT2 family glycosyltransferase
MPKISFLIATDDHPPDLDRFFGALISQTLPPSDYEVVIVDANRSHDYAGAYERARARKDVRLRLHLETIDKGSRAKSYNRGLGLCRAPIVLFFADDSMATPQTAEAHLRFHEANPDLHRVGVGSMILVDEVRTHFATWLERSGTLFGVPFSDDMTSVPDNFFYAGNSSVKRDFLLAAGPFDENFCHHAWDDYELGLRLSKLGMKACFLPQAKAGHAHAISLAGRCRTMTRAGESATVFERKYGGDQFWRSKCRVPPWRLRLYGLVSLLRYAILRRERHLISYYRARLDASFVAGYRRGSSDNGGSLVRSTGG